jgi:REase associating with pPIWI_RE/pPIWI_RE three-gene island domain Y
LDDVAKVVPVQTGFRIDDDYLTVTMLAVGLARILRRRASGRGAGGDSNGLLPAAWRVAFSRLWWRCHEQGAAAPDSDLDLLEWCTTPFAVWDVALQLSEADLQHCLLVGDELSDFAEQSARLGGGDIEAEWQENLVYAALRAAAQANGGSNSERTDNAYGTLRRRLIDYPVVSDRDVLGWEREFGRTDGSGQTYVRHLVNAAYIARPQPGRFRYLRCPGCRNTVPNLRAACGTPGCSSGPAETASTTALAVVYEQHRATRRFIRDPGLVEARLLDALNGEKFAGRIKVTPYPALDTLDILVEFLSPGDGEPVVEETWGADAKDHASARLLGRGFVWPSGEPECHQRFLVLPAHRAEEPGYIADLTGEMEGRVSGVRVVSEKNFLTLVAKRSRQTGDLR